LFDPAVKTHGMCVLFNGASHVTRSKIPGSGRLWSWVSQLTSPYATFSIELRPSPSSASAQSQLSQPYGSQCTGIHWALPVCL